LYAADKKDGNGDRWPSISSNKIAYGVFGARLISVYALDPPGCSYLRRFWDIWKGKKP
jgi:hypothetical protein